MSSPIDRKEAKALERAINWSYAEAIEKKIAHLEQLRLDKEKLTDEVFSSDQFDLDEQAQGFDMTEVNNTSLEDARAIKYSWIPPYGPMMDKLMLLKRVKGFNITDKDEFYEQLILKNWPKYIAHSVANSVRANGKVDEQRLGQLREMKARGGKRPDPVQKEANRVTRLAEGHSSPSTIGGRTKQVKALHTTDDTITLKGIPPPMYFRFPVSRVPCPFVEKPLVDSRRTTGSLVHQFRAWAHGVAYRLDKGLGVHDHRSFVSCNEPVRILLTHLFVGTRAALADMFSRASVFTVGPVKETVVGHGAITRLEISVRPKVTAKRFVVVFGYVISTSQELTRYENQFRKTKNYPIFRTAILYLDGANFNDFTVSRLRADIANAFPQKTSLQGNVQGIPINLPQPIEIHHAVSFPGLEDLFDDIRSSFEGVDGGYMRVFMQFSSFIVAVTNGRDWVSAVAACVQFISGNDYIYEMFIKALSQIRNPMSMLQDSWFSKTIAELRVWDGFYEFWSAIIGGFVTSIVETLNVGFRSLFPSIMQVVYEARVTILKASGASLGNTILLGVREVMARLTSCVKLRSFSPLWGSRYDPRRWVMFVETFIAYYPVLTSTGVEMSTVDEIADLRIAGKLPVWFTSPLCLQEFIALCESHYDDGKVMITAFKGFSELSVEITRVCVKFRTFIDNLITQKAAGNYRIKPFMVLLFGPPGGGKTNMAKEIFQAIGSVNGYDISSSSAYQWQEGVNFQDGFSHHQWCVQMDDVDQGVAKDTPGVRNYVQNVLALVNNAPFQVEAAAVELKGKLRANPRLLTYATNFTECNLRDRTNQPVAFWRRVGVRWYVRAKDDFSKGNGVLDADKANDSVSHDMYHIAVTYFDPALVNNDDLWHLPMTRPIIMSFSDAMADLQERFTRHMNVEIDRLRQVRNIDRVCPVCGLDNSTKHCAHVDGVLQGTVISKCKRQVYVLASHLERINYLLDNWIPHTVKLLAGFAVLFGVVGVVAGQIMSRLQGREYNATVGNVPKNWHRADQAFRPGLPTSTGGESFTKEDLIKSIRNSLVVINGGTMFGSIVGQNEVLMPSHALVGMFDFTNHCLDMKKKCDITLQVAERLLKVTVSCLNVIELPSNSELCLLRVSELKGVPGMKNRIWAIDDQSINSFDEVEIWGDVMYGHTSKNGRMRLQTGCVWACDIGTPNGSCGSWWIGRFGTTWKAFGMHYLWRNIISDSPAIGGEANCAIVTKDELEKCSLRIGTVLQGVETPRRQLSRVPEVATLGPYPAKSEVWVAITKGAQPYSFGELFPPLHGPTMKTKMEWSLVKDIFQPLELEWCGENGYWRMPDFRGKVIDEQWQSPFTEVFTVQNFSTPDELTMWMALSDYLGGASDLMTEGYSYISESDAIVGVPNSYINSMNLKTSVGPPFNSSKRNYFSVDEDRVPYVSDDITGMVDDFEKVMQEGDIPATVGMCTLKDEPVKPGKLPRVFTCMPAATNIILKKYFSPIKSFMRANFSFFESAVGIDMTSAEVSRIVQHLRSINPDLDNIYDADAKKLDKAYLGLFFDFIALVFYAICVVLKLDPIPAYQCVMILKHTRYIIKGDVFSMFWNPSGQDATVEFNGVLMSLMFRYLWYRKHPMSYEYITAYKDSFMSMSTFEKHVEHTFRNHNAIVTYGDDSVRALDYVESDDAIVLLKNEFGIIMTDASKSGTTFLKKTLDEIDFLKRRILWSEEYKRYISPLSKKSIIRTVLIKRESVLSSRDHACVGMSEALREMVYHGVDEYNRFKGLCDRAVAQHGLEGNSYLRIFDYSYWVPSLINGTFTAWEPRTNEKFTPTHLT